MNTATLIHLITVVVFIELGVIAIIFPVLAHLCLGAPFGVTVFMGAVAFPIAAIAFALAIHIWREFRKS